MARASTQELSPSPFTTYRDPKTGQWIVSHNPGPSSSKELQQDIKLLETISALSSPQSH